jgi:hypothetical protein
VVVRARGLGKASQTKIRSHTNGLFVWLVLICSERKVLLIGCWWLICSEIKVLLAGG